MPATTEHVSLAGFLARCDPAAAAEESQYVSRPHPFAPWLAEALPPVARGKVLLMGQPGVGKTTELTRLTDALGEHFTVVRPPLEETLDLGLVGWHDILVFAALSLPRLSSVFLPLMTLEKALTRGASGPDVPAPNGIQAFRNNPRGVHDRIEAARAQFWDMSLAVLDAQAQSSERPVLLVLDGLEKLPSPERLFVEQRRHLTALPLRCVVTAPLGLSFSSNFGEIEGDFLAVTRLRALSHRKGEPGFQFLLDLAKRRGAGAVMADRTMEELISWTGGLPRQMLQLLGASATAALTDGLASVEPELCRRAIRRVAERWQYQLGPRDYEALKRSDEERSPEDRARLLALGALLEYDLPDGGLRLGINPLVGLLLKSPP